MTRPAPTPPQPMTVLFADPDHGPRAQMAEALLRAADHGGMFDVASAGTAPGAELAGVAEALAECNATFKPASRALDVSMEPDLLIVVCEEGCAACPYLPRAARVVRWPLEGPGGLSRDARWDALRALADKLHGLVTGLVDSRLPTDIRTVTLDDRKGSDDPRGRSVGNERRRNEQLQEA